MRKITNQCDVCGAIISAQEKGIIKVFGSPVEQFKREFISEDMMTHGALVLCAECMKSIFSLLKSKHTFRETIKAMPKCADIK